MLRLMRDAFGSPPGAAPDARQKVMDEAHLAVWHAVRHLFPDHAMADQTDHGYLLVSWSMPGTRDAHCQFAAPILLRIEAGLLLALWMSGDTERRALARLQERAVREGLSAYDPHARIAALPVIVLGTEMMS